MKPVVIRGQWDFTRYDRLPPGTTSLVVRDISVVTDAATVTGELNRLLVTADGSLEQVTVCGINALPIWPTNPDPSGLLKGALGALNALRELDELFLDNVAVQPGDGDILRTFLPRAKVRHLTIFTSPDRVVRGGGVLDGLFVDDDTDASLPPQLTIRGIPVSSEFVERMVASEWFKRVADSLEMNHGAGSAPHVLACGASHSLHTLDVSYNRARYFPNAIPPIRDRFPRLRVLRATGGATSDDEDASITLGLLDAVADSSLTTLEMSHGRGLSLEVVEEMLAKVRSRALACLTTPPILLDPSMPLDEFSAARRTVYEHIATRNMRQARNPVPTQPRTSLMKHTPYFYSQ